MTTRYAVVIVGETVTETTDETFPRDRAEWPCNRIHSFARDTLPELPMRAYIQQVTA